MSCPTEWPSAKEQRLVSSQQPARNRGTQSNIVQDLNPANDPVNKPGSRPFLVEPSYEIAALPRAGYNLLRNLEPEHTSKPHHTPNPQKLWEINVHIFKPLSFRVTCCTVIDSQHTMQFNAYINLHALSLSKLFIKLIIPIINKWLKKLAIKGSIF